MPSSSSLVPEVGTIRPAAETASSLDAAETDGSNLQAPAPQQQRHTRRARRKAARLISSEDSSDSEGDSWTRWEGLSGQPQQVTSSYRHLDTLDGCHEYHISGFSLAQKLGPGVRLCSDYFEVADQLWRVEVYPAGVSAEAGTHLSLFLTTPGCSATANQVLHKLVIVDQSGKGHHIVKSNSRVSGFLLASRGIVAAYPKAAKLTHLMTHARHYLLHDTLLIRATVQIVRSWSYEMPALPSMLEAGNLQNLQHEELNMPYMQQWGQTELDQPWQ